MGLVDSIINVESGGDPNARNPNSSASGPGQFIDATWLDVVRKARPDLANQSDDQLLALKTNPEIARQATEAYAAQNGQFLAKNGLPVTPGTTYLAHFAGPQGALSVLQADPNAPASSVLRPDAIAANPFLKNMTVADLRAWADRKMGSAAPQAPQPQPAPASPTSAPSGPLSIAPQTPPIFAPAPQAAPQQQASAPAPFEAPDPMQMAPIFYAQRRSPDLSKLRAAFQATVFPRG